MIHLSDSEFDRVIEEALAEIPPQFAAYLENVVVEAINRPTPRMMREQDIPDDTLGFYDGVPLEEKQAAFDGPPVIDRIYIFRDNLREMCEDEAELRDEIRITVLHEIGHHFGLEEDQLDDLGYG